MNLELIQPSERVIDQIELIEYKPRSIVGWLLDRPKEPMKSTTYPGRTTVTRCIIKSVGEELELGKKFNHLFGTTYYSGIMPVATLSASFYSEPKLFVYECTVDSLVDTVV